MKSFQKRFVVPTETAVAVVASLNRCVCTVNQRKLGKHRRGRVLFLGYLAMPVGDRAFEFVCEFASGGSAFMRWHGTGKHQVYRFMDINKPLRTLALQRNA
jgi:hypothetical protein